MNMYFYRVVLQFCLYLNLGCKGIFEVTKSPSQTDEAL